MTKGDLVDILAEGTGLTKIETAAVIDGFIATIKYALKNGQRVDIRGLGSFRVVERKPRRARNPVTGELLNIPRKKVPVFRVSSGLKAYINEAYKEEQLELL